MAKAIANLPKTNGEKEKKMKKSKIKMLTAAACLALVGTASAAWVYAGTATASANVGVKVASYADAGSITVKGADNVYVYLDKGAISFKKDDATVALAAKYEKPAGFDGDTKTITKTFQVVINSGLQNVVSFANGVTTESNLKSSWIEWEDDTDIFNSLPSLQWNSGYFNLNSEFASENAYKSFVAYYCGYSTDDYSWYDQNETYTFKSDFNFTINFKAVVSD